MKKILIISTNSDEAGAPKHIEYLVNQLARRYFFAFIFGDVGPVYDRLKASGFEVHLISGMKSNYNLLRDVNSTFRLINIVKHCRPDVIHTHSAKASFLGRICAKMLRVKSVYTVHGWGWRGKNALGSFVIWFAEYSLAKLVYTNYIYVARSVQQEASKYLSIPMERGSVIYNGVPLCPCENSIQENALPNRKLRFLMAARVSDAKDHETLFRAFEVLEQSNYQLTLCGNGTNSAEFMSFARQLAPNSFSHFEFLGESSSMDDIYSYSDVVLLISKYEALPLTIIEAMSKRKCVIATNVGGVSELIVHEVNGLLVQKRDVEGLLCALKNVFSAEVRHTLSANARRSFIDGFCVDVMANKVASIYDED